MNKKKDKKKDKEDSTLKAIRNQDLEGFLKNEG